MFKFKDLEPYFGKKMQINNMEFTLEKHEELSGELAVWIGESYTIRATPYYDNVPVPVDIVDISGQEIGTDGYYVAVDDYDRYCKVVKVLSEKILRIDRM